MSAPIINSTHDPDDAPEWTADQVARAEFAIGGKVVRPAEGTLTKRGRPKTGQAKTLISLRLETELVQAMRASGEGWQARARDALRAEFGPKSGSRP